MSAAPDPQKIPVGNSAPSRDKLAPDGAARPVPWKAIAAGVTAIAAAFVIHAGLTVPTPPAAPDAGEQLGGSEMAQLDTNRSALESAGLAAGSNIYVRDYAAIDGDAVVLNGLRVPLEALPTMLAVARGPVELMAVAGSTGCVTVEIGDGAGVYQLCLRDGDPIRTRAR
jgi:hypothetical protein